jgi:hypothetical protein
MKQQHIDAWVKRAEEVLAMNGWESLTPIHMFAVSFVEAFYGPASVQFKSLKDSVDAMQRNSKSGPPVANIAVFCRGVIEATLAEIKAGLIALQRCADGNDRLRDAGRGGAHGGSIRRYIEAAGSGEGRANRPT